MKRWYSIALAAPLLFLLSGSPYAGIVRNHSAAIIDLSSGADGALLVGGWDGKSWVADKTFYRSVKGGEKYRFYSLVRPLGTATGSKPRLSEASGSAYQVQVAKAPNGRTDIIGLTGAWNAMPRLPRLLTAKTAEYEAMVKEVLKEKKLAGAAVHITRVVKVDLEGGADEVLISATCPRLANDAGEALLKPMNGDYSFVMLRRASGGKVATYVLDGCFLPNPAYDDTVNVYTVGGVLDLNGDGVMEVIVRSQYYEGGGAKLFEMKNGRPRKVLAAVDGA
jgi:hypothetical protein